MDTPVARQWKIVVELLTRPEGATARELVKLTGVVERTVKRDLATLRKAGVPLEEKASSHGRRHWKLMGWNVDLTLNFEEAGGLFLAVRLLDQQLRGTLFADSANRALRKLRSKLAPSVVRFLEIWASRVSLADGGISNYSARQGVIDELARAIEDRTIVFLLYQSPRATEPVPYEAYPLRLVLHRGSAYVEAWIDKSKKVQTFKLDRLHGVEPTAMKFQLPAECPEEDPTPYRWGVFSGDGPPRRVVIRFTGAEPTQYVLEKTWPTERQKARKRDGSVELELEVTAFEEVASWVRSFGAAAEVLEPDELREQMQDEARRVGEIYAAGEQPCFPPVAESRESSASRARGGVRQEKKRVPPKG